MIDYPNKAQLEELYVNQNKNILDICKIYKTSKSKISALLKMYEIPLKRKNKSKPIPPKEELYELYINMKKTCKDIGVIYKVNRNLVGRWLEHYNIEVNKPPKEEIEKYYIENKLTEKQISNIYGVSRQTISRWLISFNIPTRSNVRKYYHLKAIPFTNIQKEFIIGTLLGDGHIGGIGKKKQSKRLSMTHGEKQLDYLLWKKQIMNNFVNNINSRVQEKRNNCVIWSWTSITHNEFSMYHKLFYDNTKKVIRNELINFFKSPMSLAIWIMDDGWKNHSNIRISSESFTEEENVILQNILKINFDLNCKICEYTRNDKKYYYISFNKNNSIKLSNLIRPYVIDTLKYKLLSENDCSPTTTC